MKGRVCPILWLFVYIDETTTDVASDLDPLPTHLFFFKKKKRRIGVKLRLSTAFGPEKTMKIFILLVAKVNQTHQFEASNSDLPHLFIY